MGIEERYRLKKREVFLSRCISLCMLLSYFLFAKFALSWFLSEHLATQISNFIYR